MSLIYAPENWQSYVFGKPIEALTKEDIARIITMLHKREADIEMCGEAGHGVVAAKNWVDSHT